MAEKTLKQLASDAVQVQNACNILGITNSFAQAMVELRRLNVGGTDEIANHPITRLWASKVHELAGMGLSDMERYGNALRECEALAAN